MDQENARMALNSNQSNEHIGDCLDENEPINFFKHRDSESVQYLPSVAPADFSRDVDDLNQGR